MLSLKQMLIYISFLFITELFFLRVLNFLIILFKLIRTNTNFCKLLYNQIIYKYTNTTPSKIAAHRNTYTTVHNKHVNKLIYIFIPLQTNTLCIQFIYKHKNITLNNFMHKPLHIASDTSFILYFYSEIAVARDLIRIFFETLTPVIILHAYFNYFSNG